ncbi:hypothetical protein L5515_007167 [Caenorhabditis briggsae]|uniref:G-protein coupled receptors family 1 profile domain-containing protein n=2 Tax=Caenorhabditis briggsae TaxID=6238 RepID=A0AAE9JKU9_CAEBR|nr:hypothetical protein L5515_007167 [Caenorhabditis briggsae]
MLGMAICDLFSMIVNISVCDIILHFFGDLCTPPYSLLVNHVFWILVSIRDDVIRCSTWLSVLMALLRYLVSKYFAKSQFQNLSRFEYGVKASIISFVISSIFSAGYYLSVKFEPVGIWTPDESCANVPMNMEHPIYEQRVSDLFSLGNGAPLRIFQLINGSVSKIIPCILLPILTFLLAVELRKNDQSRNTGSVLYKNNTEKTTILVIIMTVLIFVASLPTGIATVFQVAYTDLGYLQIAFYSVRVEFYIAFFGILLTTFHIIILSRKSMMTSSVISIMIGIAIFDMTSMIITIGTNHMLYNTEGSECTPPATLFSFHVFWFFISVRDLVRRSATWLGVLMAFIRYAGLKYAMNAAFQKLTKPILGVHAIVISVIPSFLLSIFYWMRYEFVNSETDIWRPLEECKNYAPEISRPIVNQRASRFFTDNHGIVGKVYMLLNGTVSKILPCILLPILTILLAIELQKAKNVRKNLGGSGREKSTERTTILVIFMALSFFIAEIPIGTALALQVAYTDIGFLFLATFVNHLCNALFTINSITHCLIFFVMSSQYRTTVSTYTGFPKLEITSRNTVLSTAKRSSY